MGVVEGVKWAVAEGRAAIYYWRSAAATCGGTCRPLLSPVPRPLFPAVQVAQLQQQAAMIQHNAAQQVKAAQAQAAAAAAVLQQQQPTGSVGAAPSAVTAPGAGGTASQQ